MQIPAHQSFGRSALPTVDQSFLVVGGLAAHVPVRRRVGVEPVDEGQYVTPVAREWVALEVDPVEVLHSRDHLQGGGVQEGELVIRHVQGVQVGETGRIQIRVIL